MLVYQRVSIVHMHSISLPLPLSDWSCAVPTWSDWSQAGCCQGGAPVTSWYLEDNLQTFQKYIWYISKDGGVLQSWLKLKEEVMVFPWVNHGVFRFSQTPKVVGQGTHALPSAPGIDPFGALHKYIYIYILTNPYWSACLHNSAISDRWHPTWIPIPPFCHSLQARAAQPSPIPCRNYVRKGLVRMCM